MTKQEDERYNSALSFATQKHEGQQRIGGDAYITHPIAVAEILRQKGYEGDYLIAALFHDLLEDTNATEAEISAIGGEEVLKAVKLLTKEKGYVMADYVAGIIANPIARAVKAADRLHNLRCALVTSDEFKRRYILETIDWYLQLDAEIPQAVKALVASLSEPLAEQSLIYKAIEESEIIIKEK